MTRWAIVVDQNKCIGCATCRHVCDDANAVPFGVSWRKFFEISDTSSKPSAFLTMSCMHCQKAPCVNVCPTGASYQRDDGIVKINTDLCIGCAACILACPYNARSISHQDRIVKNNGSLGNLKLANDRIGVCTKCDFCADKIDNGLKHGLQPGIDLEATPLCVRYCISGALVFGDLDDPNSNINSLKEENTAICLHPEHQTEPSVFYIPSSNRTVQAMAPQIQNKWRWPAVANFILGGAGAGLYILNAILSFLTGGHLQASYFPYSPWISVILVITGFCCIPIETGRPLRAYHLINNFKQSWISKESFFFLLFLLFALISFFVDYPVYMYCAVFAAFGLIISHGLIVSRANAIITWHQPLTPPLFISSAFFSGLGLLFALVTFIDPVQHDILLKVGIVCIAINLIIWLFFIYHPDSTVFTKSIRSLKLFRSIISIDVLGHFFPLLIAILYLLVPDKGFLYELKNELIFFSGILILYGASMQKLRIISKTGFLKGIDFQP